MHAYHTVIAPPNMHTDIDILSLTQTDYYSQTRIVSGCLSVDLVTPMACNAFIDDDCTRRCPFAGEAFQRRRDFRTLGLESGRDRTWSERRLGMKYGRSRPVALCILLYIFWGVSVDNYSKVHGIIVPEGLLCLTSCWVCPNAGDIPGAEHSSASPPGGYVVFCRFASMRRTRAAVVLVHAPRNVGRAGDGPVTPGADDACAVHRTVP